MVVAFAVAVAVDADWLSDPDDDSLWLLSLLLLLSSVSAAFADAVACCASTRCQ